MKFAVVILTVVAAASAQFFSSKPGTYNPGTYQGAYQPFQKKYPTPVPFRQYVSSTPAPLTFAPSTFAPIAPTYAPVVPKVSYNGNEQSANTLRYDNVINPDGSYAYAIETDNGIAAQESGALKAFSPNEASLTVSGSYRYPVPGGGFIDISYVADENGFQPTGNAIPTPHPIPEAIQRSIAYNLANAKVQ